MEKYDFVTVTDSKAKEGSIWRWYRWVLDPDSTLPNREIAKYTKTIKTIEKADTS